jgi:glycosyltransferase involved in cell wall biosynthesis
VRVLRIYPMANDARFRRRDLALRRRGAEVGLVVPERYGLDWSVAPVERELPYWRSRLINRNSIPLHLWDQRVLQRAVEDFQPDVVDVHEEAYFPAAAQAVAAAGGRPVVMFAAQNIAKRFLPPVRALRGWVLKRLAGAYPCCEEAASLLRLWGFRGRVSVIPYGVDDELFRVRPRGDRIGFLGRLVPEKGVLDLVELAPQLLCVGEGPLAGELRGAGAEVVTARSTQELAEQLARMAVLVAPSRTTTGWKEQFGRMVVEAMAAGVPVVAYASGSLPEVVGDAGVLVPEGDRRRLTAVVRQVLTDAGDLGERGRARAAARYRWDAVAEQMIDLYERCA